MDRRKPGSSRHVTQRRETDTVEILSGVYEGRTTGTAIGFLVRNEDQRSKDYSAIAEKFRPGHADYTYWQKYGIRDRARRRPRLGARDGGARGRRRDREEMAEGALRGPDPRLSGAARPHHDSRSSPGTTVDANPFFAADREVVPELEKFMDQLRESGDSCGARVNVVAQRRAGGLGRAGVRPARRRHRGRR